ncbi:hypothetical protein H0H81_001374 [Sphagnurus paluster]|uniref:Uncharacterized protein n=1 Tax=Sphagnurus paluster TaxID=117069 RepID=A0A9P7GH53_9AGAR|nr:hypothetical protein H0H81_001374 [Sphagnurus paluster]
MLESLRLLDEAYSSSLKLQRHSLDAANAHERAVHLERENKLLRSELAALRAHPHPDAGSNTQNGALQLQQLTLSLRRLSDKLTLAEDALHERTVQLAHATGEAARAKLAEEGAYELSARTRGREEAGKLRELALEGKVRASEEAVKMSDLVLNEYADLVRAMDIKAGIRGDKFHSSSATLVGGNGDAALLADRLAEGKMGLQRLLSEFSAESEKLHTELLKTQAELAASEAKRDAEHKYTEECRIQLAQAQFELHRLKMDDNAAAKMVSRYMKFSQKSTDTLQSALFTLKTRHAATLETLSAELAHHASQSHIAHQQVDKLRDALDELGGELAKEAFGRRREVAQRIRMLGREEKLSVALERWVLRAEEALQRGETDPRLEKMIESARGLLDETLGGAGEESQGTLARLILAQSAVEALEVELEIETARRIDLERILVLKKSSADEAAVETNVHELYSKPPVQLEDHEHLVHAQTTPKPLPKPPPSPPSPDPASLQTSSSQPPPSDLSKETEQLAFLESQTITQPSPSLVVIDVDGDTSDLSLNDSQEGLCDQSESEPAIAPPANTSSHIHVDNDADVDDTMTATPGETPSLQALPSSFPTQPDPMHTSSSTDSPLPPTEDANATSPLRSPLYGPPHCTLNTASTNPPSMNASAFEDDLPTPEESKPGSSETDDHLPSPDLSFLDRGARDRTTPSEYPVSDVASAPPEPSVCQSRLVEPDMGLEKLNSSTLDEFSGGGVIGEEATLSDTGALLIPPPLIISSEHASSLAPHYDTPPEADNRDTRTGTEPSHPSGHTTSPSTPDVGLIGPDIEAAASSVQPQTEISPIPDAQDPAISKPTDEPTQRPPSPAASSLLPILTSPPLTFSKPAYLDIPKPPPHPLLSELAETQHRYDVLQRAFRDCHLALESLSIPSAGGGAAPPDVLRTALQRLNDYTEDARVELEIRIADEALVARGYETLLSVPGALPSPSPSSYSSHSSASQASPYPLSVHDDLDDHGPTRADIEQQIQAFVSGTDPGVAKALRGLTRKLEDVQHDIAALKRAVHEEATAPPLPPPSAPATTGTNAAGGWASWIRSPASPASHPASSSERPTFGNVMTTPRLRHSPSLNFGSVRRPGVELSAGSDPFASLGLRVPMPSYSSTSVGYAPPLLPQQEPRTRTVSTMYMLGLGGRRPSGPLGRVAPSSSPTPSPRKSTIAASMPMGLGLGGGIRGKVQQGDGETDTDAGDSDEDDTDVE